MSKLLQMANYQFWFIVQLTTYLWRIQYFSNLQCQLLVNLILTPWVVESQVVMWSMEYLAPGNFHPMRMNSGNE
ncbi:hypothetical protein Patl1_00595 [Pistacia atlantica]|uniref:Uncharacterized protein n=1 Tax=Pistacia atlantica TaxID=434234 RepID=A0ACC1C712_9ROSI|nr:hypothetical protein Patl1_00595 [Pistacia atlantica]